MCCTTWATSSPAPSSAWQIAARVACAPRAWAGSSRPPLLKEHQGDAGGLPDAGPARPRILPDYLPALADELLPRADAPPGGHGGDGPAPRAHPRHRPGAAELRQDVTLVIEECDLAQLIEDAPALPAGRAAAPRHLRDARARRRCPRVRVDKHKVLQILINLLSNAKDAMAEVPEGQRHLWVRLTAQGNVARIQVVDNGMGIRAGDPRAALRVRASPPARKGMALVCTPARWRRSCWAEASAWRAKVRARAPPPRSNSPWGDAGVRAQGRGIRP